MWRVVTSTVGAVALFSSVAAAQAPCTTDANRVVAEIYRHTLERGVDSGAQGWAQQLSDGRLTVKELVRNVTKSPEYMNRFGQTESGEGQPYERAVARLYRHILARQPDQGGQRSWANTAQQRGLATVVDGLINSAEYNNNFGDWGVPGSGGLRFCATSNNNQSSSIRPFGNGRFRSLDTNRDGVVSRGEWQGSNASFRAQDRNRDGVLSRDEVDARGIQEARNADDEFDSLDANNNNRIEEREWNGNFREFAQLDRNNDGIVSRAEYVRANTAGAAGTAATSGQSIPVMADRAWTDTGINVRAGESITISADGRIRLARDTNDFVGAEGANNRVGDATMPNAPVGGLVARFGDSAPVFIGQSRTVRVTRSGRLYLGVNDSYFDDNTGAFNARVDTN